MLINYFTQLMKKYIYDQLFFIKKKTQLSYMYIDNLEDTFLEKAHVFLIA